MAGGQETVFLSDLDLPLMPGFQEEEKSRLLFDSPEGRIIEVTAYGSAAPEKILAYYKRLLPSLGWQDSADDAKRPKSKDPEEDGCKTGASFCLMAHRNHEILLITIRRAPKIKAKTVIVFSLSPE